MVDEPLDQASARAINAEPWEPLPGMVKRRCPQFSYWFAAWPRSNELCCPDCATALSRQQPPLVSGPLCWWHLSDQSCAALESDVLPQPGECDDKAVACLDEEINVHQAPE
jgi:hypothetical protein